MKKIASFTVDHTKLKKGMYISRIDGDIITYDVRMKIPNGNDYLDMAAAHTIEHLFATYARNTSFADSIIYVGPMGCRTGFYFLVRDSVSKAKAIEIVRDSMKFIRDYTGEIPGLTKEECGNYREHSLSGAKKVAADMTEVLSDWTEQKLDY
ncbi:MAG: S-ribosylhomocysteine lyase [Clostridia bacterium]|nr:S-ribosylhomocysteine lyase [Clostridia bacterium]